MRWVPKAFKIIDVLLSGKGDMAVLLTSEDLPSSGLKLVEGYDDVDLKRFLEGGLLVSGYADVDEGRKLSKQEPRALLGQPSMTPQGVVRSFQVMGGLNEGLSGSPCVVRSATEAFVIGMAQQGGAASSNSLLISSHSLLEFLRRQFKQVGSLQVVKARQVETHEEQAREKELNSKLDAIAERILEETKEISLVDRKEDMLSDDPLRQLFQPLPLLRNRSEDEQNALIERLGRHPTATEMGLFDKATVEQRARDYVAGTGGTARGETPEVILPTLDWKWMKCQGGSTLTSTVSSETVMRRTRRLG